MPSVPAAPQNTSSYRQQTYEEAPGITRTETYSSSGPGQMHSSTVIEGTSVNRVDNSQVIEIEGEIKINEYPW